MSTSSVLTGTEIPLYYMFVLWSPRMYVETKLTFVRYQMPVTAGAQILHATGNVCVSGAARTAATFALSGVLGLFVLIVAIVL